MAESLRDQLEANLDQIITRPEDEVGTQPAASPSGVIGEAKSSKIGERVRDDSGKFVASEKQPEKSLEKSIEKPAAAPAKPATATPPQAGGEQAAAAATPKKLAKPDSWKKDFSPHWDKLTSGGQLDPAEAQALAEYLIQRETDFRHGVGIYKREWDNAQPLVKAMQPFLPLLQQNNIDPATWIGNLGSAHRALVFGSPGQKLQMMAKLAQDYGVPLQALTDPSIQQQFLSSAAMSTPPQNLLTREEAEQFFNNQFARHASDQQVAQFLAQKEKFPYVESVSETMAQLLESGLADDLPSAYEAALKLPRHSEIWQEVQEQDRARTEEERRRAEAERVSKAKGKALSVRSSTPTAQSEEKPRDRRSQIAESLDAVMGAGRV